MPKTAQQKFNEYLDDCRETQTAVNLVESASRDCYGDYAWACGVFSAMLNRAIAELPKTRRQQFRSELRALAERTAKEAQ